MFREPQLFLSSSQKAEKNLIYCVCSKELTTSNDPVIYIWCS